MSKKPAPPKPETEAKPRYVPPKRKPEEFYTLPLELFSVADLTDALGIDRAATILGTSSRAIYTVRNTNEMGLERVAKLQKAIREDETGARSRLVQMRNLQAMRRASRPETSETTTTEETAHVHEGAR